jgi:hypothetical protein
VPPPLPGVATPRPSRLPEEPRWLAAVPDPRLHACPRLHGVRRMLASVALRT